MVEVILLQHPEKARPAEEIAELKLLYKPGQTISIYEDYPSEDEDESVDEEEEWTAANNADFVWHPCPACTEGGEFTCLAPITPSIDGHHVFSSWYQGHMKCTFCDRSVPTTWKPYRCDICSDVSCGNMFPCANKPDSEGWIAAVEG